MRITDREFWTLIHGMGFGAAYLLAFAGGLAELYSLRTEVATLAAARVRRLRYGVLIMAALVWLTVLVGTYVVYPWYRAAPPSSISTTAQSETLRTYPRSYLLASEETADYHNFGMEWKEHVAWVAPLLATVVAFAVLRFGHKLSTNRKALNMVMTWFFLSFAVAGIAGVLGALITKAAPVG